jgi:glycine/serine hydroxymethyltransferase
MREGEMRRIAELIDRVLSDPANEALAAADRAEVVELARAFPLYPVRVA